MGNCVFCLRAFRCDSGAAGSQTDRRGIATDLNDSRPTIMFASREHLDRAEALLPKADFISDLYVTDATEKASSNGGGRRAVKDLKARVEQEGRERSTEDSALIIYTSGTTGKPKGVL